MFPDWAGSLVDSEGAYAQAQNVFLFQGPTMEQDDSVKTLQIFVIQSCQTFN